jgi:hypothetical protein
LRQQDDGLMAVALGLVAGSDDATFMKRCSWRAYSLIPWMASSAQAGAGGGAKRRVACGLRSD